MGRISLVPRYGNLPFGRTSYETSSDAGHRIRCSSSRRERSRAFFSFRYVCRARIDFRRYVFIAVTQRVFARAFVRRSFVRSFVSSRSMVLIVRLVVAD